MGRPPTVEINDKKLKALMNLKPSLEDCATLFDVSAKTIQRYIKDNYGETFVQFRDKNMVTTRHALVRKAMSMALDKENPNVTMLIFSLKNLAGWSDKQDIDHSTQGKPFQLNYKV
jgi:hypothetical protein